MKKIQFHRIVGTSIALTMPMIVSAQTTFFSDTFTNGSSVNSATPASPTTTNTAYQIISTKAQTPTPAISSKDLVFGIASTSSGVMEVQALFATNPIALVLPGDNMQLTIVFTNRSGILTPPATSQLGIGLFNSGNLAPFKPLPGGTNASTGIALSDYAQKWQGYVGQIVSGASKIITRPSQAAAVDGWNQELVLSGSSTGTARNQANVGSATATVVSLTTGAIYTEVLSMVLTDVNSLAITNTLYSGAGTGGTVVVSSGGIATNTTFLTGGFNGFGFGYQAKASGPSNTIDVASILVTGSVTPVSGPPTIDQQPVDVIVPNGGSCAFSVAATGYSVTYQWKRNGTNLLNGGNISGATSSQLVISPVGPADVLSGANGYFVVVTGAGPFSTNSEKHSLSLGTAKNLIYSGSGPWDLNTSPSWLDNVLTPGFTFNFGDSVTFDDNGGGGTVTLNGNYLSASSVTVSHTFAVYTWTGTGNFAGSGNLIYNGSSQFNINNANSFSGGTVISNASARLHLGNANGLGTGPVTLAMAGGTMEWTVGGSASAGLGDIIVADDFAIQFDTFSTFSGVILGNLSGTAGKTLTLNSNPANSSTNERVRIYGTNTICNANIAFGSSLMSLAPYEGTGTQIYNGLISGDGSLWQRGSGSTILNGANTYTGGTYATAGGIGFGIDSTPTMGAVTSGPIGIGPLYISPENGSGNGSGTVFASGSARTIANVLQYPTNNQVLIVGGTNALTFNGAYSLKGIDGLATNRTFQVNNTNAWVTISGVIDDGGTGCGFIKSGAGTLALNATETYSGLTTVSAGTLAGTGSIAGSVLVTTNASIGAGSAGSIGTLAVVGDLTLTNGGGFFRVNRSGSLSDLVSVSGVLTNTGNGKITVTNLGAALQVGDTFAVFNKAVIGGSTLTISGGGVVWTNKLAVNGTIQVIPSVNTNPTNLTVVVNNGKLELSWPADRTGWHLQSQTNSLAKGLGTNWVTITGTDTDNHYTNTITTTNGSVFYRMIYP